jgi:polysaccharide export outer membrane protein
MKLNSVFYQLFFRSIYRVPAFGLSLFLGLYSTTFPVVAQQQINNPLENTTTDPINQTPIQNSNFATTETDYTLGAGDLIKLDIFQVEEYSGEYPVLVDGTISLPLVGRVNVSGLTIKEASDLVSQKYSLYLKRPVITVGLLSPRPLKIGVSGEVDNPGSYQVSLTEQNKEFPSVTDLIQQAGGITTLADVRNVQVKRTIQGREQVFNANLWALLTQGQLNQDMSLRDGDTIFIPTVEEINGGELSRLADASFGLQTDKPIKVAIVGEVYRPGSYTVQPEKESNKSGENAQIVSDSLPPRLTQAIGVSGGVKPLANVRKIEIRRQAWDGTEKKIAVDLWNLLQSGNGNEDIILQKGDTIVIPQADKLAAAELETLASASFSPDKIRVNVVGEVATPGPVEVPPNTPLNQAILAAGGFDNARAKRGSVQLVRLNPNGTVAKRQIEIDFAQDVNEETNPNLRNNDVVIVSRSGAAAVGDVLGTVISPFTGTFSFLRAIFGGF